MKAFFKPAVFVLSLILLTNCMESKGESSGTSTKDGAYNQDAQTPEPNHEGGSMQTHKPNTGPENDSDSMQ